ncbi:9080_t:CDS:2, partial [Gigaspora rosea]
PTASVIYEKLSRWYNIVSDSTAKDEDELAMLKAFISADAIIPTLSTELQIYSKDKLTSKPLNFKNLSEPVNSTKLSKIYDSNICNFSVPDEYCDDIS